MNASRSAFGREAEVRRHAEAAEALAEDAPALDPERLAERLRVADDRVGAEMAQPVGLGHRDRRRAAGAALVEQQHAELLQRAAEPARRGGHARGARRLVAGPALEVDEERPVRAVGVGDLAREHSDLGAVGVGVVERDLELMFGDEHRRRC